MAPQSWLALLKKHGTVLVIVLGLCLYTLHLQHSNIGGFGERTSFAIDSYSHLEYIARVARHHWALPAPDACWECHQPPLYYMLAAVPYSIGGRLHLLPADTQNHARPVLLGSVPTSPVVAVRILSLCFYVLFLYFGARVLRLEVRSPAAYYTGLCLLVFWPYGVIKSSMISNDMPLYMAEAAVLYYILRWRREEAAVDLALAILWNGIAIAFKYSGIVLTAFTVGVVLLKMYEKQRLAWQLLEKRVVVCACVATVLAGGTFARTYYHYRIVNRSDLPLLVPTAPVVINLRPVANDRLEYFIKPDLESYRQDPFIGERHRQEQRYFVNYVLKSSLFGIPRWTPVATARALTVLLAGMIAYMAWSLSYIAIADRAAASDLRPLGAFVALQVSALVSYRLVYPHTANQDFRFIYPTTIAMAVLYARTLTGGRVGAWLGGVLATGFCGTSVTFFLLSAQG